jgi:hypothetical protein
MSFDDWEALRILKCVAALKLMRRRPPLFVPVALAVCGRDQQSLMDENIAAC